MCIQNPKFGSPSIICLGIMFVTNSQTNQQLKSHILAIGDNKTYIDSKYYGFLLPHFPRKNIYYNECRQFLRMLLIKHHKLYFYKKNGSKQL